MMRRLLAIFALLNFAFVGYAQVVPVGFDLANYGVRIEADKRLIVVLAALEMAETKDAAGRSEKVLKTPLSEKGTAFREQLEREIKLPDDLRQKITIFVSQHKKRHAGATDAEIVAPFISMAYALTPVPELADPVITTDLPGSLLDVLDFAPLVREFYRRSGISGKLDGYSKAYQSDADSSLRSSAKELVSELLNYLHTQPRVSITEKVTTQTKNGKGKATLQQVETREYERRFVIVPEKLAPKGNITFLNIRDDYYVIVPPDTDLSFSDARRAFLQFVIDPLILSNAKEISPIRAWAKPILDERRKSAPNLSPDVFLAISRSLVAAADVRQAEFSQIKSATQAAIRKIDQIQANAERSGASIDKSKLDSEKRAVSAELERTKQALSDEATLKLYEDYEKGAILSFYFAEQLRGVEDSGFDIASSLREMLASFDPLKEADRLTATAEARKRAVAAREARKAAPNIISAVSENPVTRRLLEIQKVIDSKEYSRAEAELKSVLASGSSDPRVYYTLGRVASLEAAAAADDPDTQAQKLLDAKVAFSNVISKATPDTDKALLSLTYVALARIYEYNDDNAYAVKLYDMAIALKEVTGGAYHDAIAAKQRLIKLN